MKTSSSSHDEVKVNRTDSGWTWNAYVDGNKVGSGFTFASEADAYERGESCIEEHRYDNLVDDGICPFCGSGKWNGQMCPDCGNEKESSMKCAYDMDNPLEVFDMTSDDGRYIYRDEDTGNRFFIDQEPDGQWYLEWDDELGGGIKEHLDSPQSAARYWHDNFGRYASKKESSMKKRSRVAPKRSAYRKTAEWVDYYGEPIVEGDTLEYINESGKPTGQTVNVIRVKGDDYLTVYDNEFFDTYDLDHDDTELQMVKVSSSKTAAVKVAGSIIVELSPFKLNGETAYEGSLCDGEYWFEIYKDGYGWECRVVREEPRDDEWVFGSGSTPNEALQDAIDCMVDMGVRVTAKIVLSASIKDELIAAGVPESEIETDNLGSDLYVKVSPQSEQWLDGYEYKGLVERFIDDIDHEPWFEIPFGNFGSVVSARGAMKKKASTFELARQVFVSLIKTDYPYAEYFVQNDGNTVETIDAATDEDAIAMFLEKYPNAEVHDEPIDISNKWAKKTADAFGIGSDDEFEVLISGDYCDGSALIYPSAEDKFLECEIALECWGDNGEEEIEAFTTLDIDYSPLAMALEIIQTAEFEYGDELGIDEYDIVNQIQPWIYDRFKGASNGESAWEFYDQAGDMLDSKRGFETPDEALDDVVSRYAKKASAKKTAYLWDDFKYMHPDLFKNGRLVVAQGKTPDGETVELCFGIDSFSGETSPKIYVDGRAWHAANTLYEAEEVYYSLVSEGVDETIRKYASKKVIAGNERVIHTDFDDPAALAVLQGTLGQMSDGIWENSNGMDGYWMFCDIDNSCNIVIDGERSVYRWGKWTENRFYNKSDDEVKRYLANKVKAVCKEWIGYYGGKGWKRDNAEDQVDFYHGIGGSWSDYPTVQDAYRVYDSLLGRQQRIFLSSRKASTNLGEWEDEYDGSKWRLSDCSLMGALQSSVIPSGSSVSWCVYSVDADREIDGGFCETVEDGMSRCDAVVTELIEMENDMEYGDFVASRKSASIDWQEVPGGYGLYEWDDGEYVFTMQKPDASWGDTTYILDVNAIYGDHTIVDSMEFDSQEELEQFMEDEVGFNIIGSSFKTATDWYGRMMDVAEVIGYEKAYDEVCHILSTDQLADVCQTIERNYDLDVNEGYFASRKVAYQEITNVEDFDYLYGQSALTWEGMSADRGNLDAIFDAFGEAGAEPKDDLRFFEISGREMNDRYSLTGSNAYPDDLTILSIPLEDFGNPNALVMWRFQYGARWFDDIVDNNASRQGSRKASVDENTFDDIVDNAYAYVKDMFDSGELASYDDVLSEIFVGIDSCADILLSGAELDDENRYDAYDIICEALTDDGILDFDRFRQ